LADDVLLVGYERAVEVLVVWLNIISGHRHLLA